MPSVYKKIILTILVSIFVGTGFLLILMALGWLPDFKHLRIVKTGGIYVKFTPTDATLYVSNEPYKLRGFIGGGLLVSGLFPGEYNLLLTKEGYEDWQKILTISPGKVTVANKIRLWSKFHKTETVASGTVDFWLTRLGPIKLEGRSLFFENLKLRGNTVNLSSSESNLIVTKGTDDLFLFNLDTPFTATNLDELFNHLKQNQLGIAGTVPLEQVLYHPFSSQKLILKTRFSVYSLDLKKVELEKLFTASTTNFLAMGSNEIFILQADGNLTAVNLLLNSTSSLNTLPIGRLNIAKIFSLKNGEKILILDKNGELFLHKRVDGTFTDIAQNIVDFSVSPEEKRVFARDNQGKIYIVFIDDYRANDDSLIPAGTLTELPPKIWPESGLPNWIADEPNYALTKTASGLHIIELDPRLPTNDYLIATATQKYALDENKLFLLKQGGEILKLEL